MIFRIVFDYGSRTLVSRNPNKYKHKILRGYCGTIYPTREEAERAIEARSFPKNYYKNVRVEEE